MNGRGRASLPAVMAAGILLLGGCVADDGGATPTTSTPAPAVPTSEPDTGPTADPSPSAASAVLPTECGTLAGEPTRAETVGDMTLQSNGADFVRPAPEGSSLALGCDWIVGEASGVLLLISTADDAAVTAGLDALTADGWECQPGEDFGAQFCQVPGGTPETEEVVVAREGVWIYLSSVNRNARAFLSEIVADIFPS